MSYGHAGVRAASWGLRFMRCDRCGVVFHDGKVFSTRLTWGPNPCPIEKLRPRVS